jgi:hypothetical protein
MRYSVRPESRRKRCPGCNRVRFIPLGTAPYCMESCRRNAQAEHDKTSQENSAKTLTEVNL